MTLADIQKQDIFQTRSIAEACRNSMETLAYIANCIARFFKGDYGEIDIADIRANNKDLRDGEGHILARYKAEFNLCSDIYIEAHFSKEIPGIDANNTMIMYCDER